MPDYVLTQELLDDVYALLAEGRKLRAEVNALQTNREPKPRDVWAQITSASTTSVTISGTSRSGFYPATWHYRDEDGQAWSTGVTCWLKDANGVALTTSKYYRSYLIYADDDGVAVFYVDRDSGTGTGDVVGPSSATDNAIARFDGTTGKLIQNSAAIVTDAGNVVADGDVQAKGQDVIVGANDGVNKTVLLTNDATGLQLWQHYDFSGGFTTDIVGITFLSNAGGTAKHRIFNQTGSGPTYGAVAYSIFDGSEHIGGDATTGGLTFKGGLYISGTAGTITKDTTATSGYTVNNVLYADAGGSVVSGDNNFVYNDGTSTLLVPNITTDGAIRTDSLYVQETADASHYMRLTTSSNLTADRTLDFVIGDSNRTLTISGNTTLAGGNHSGTNTGDQTITLTGDVTGSGTGSFAATIANDVVTFAKMQNIATDRLIGRDTAGSGDPEEISVGSGLAFTGSAGIGISTNGVTDAMLRQGGNCSVVGRAANSTGNVADISSSINGSYFGRESNALGFFAGRMTKGYVKAQTDGNAADSYNVTSLTDNGAGDVTITWDTDFSTAHYAVTASAQSDSALICTVADTSFAAGTTRIKTFNTGGTLSDPNYFHAIAIGTQ